MRIVALIILTVAGIFLHQPPIASALEGHPVAQNTGQAQQVETIKSTEDDMSCEVDITGWIVCQVAELLGKLTDGMFSLLKTMLHIEPIGRGTPGGDRLYEIWSSFRNIANAIFIILFLAVIWSHLTGYGISNYTIKKMLPRLVVNIIMVNASYYIGLVIVDTTNIIGASLKELLDSISGSIHYAPHLNGWRSTGALVLGIGAMALYIYMFAFSFFPLVVSALISFFIVVIILVARQAVIIMLIIISPIAFALNVLPNTQKWFSRWWTAIATTATIYPIIAIVYGGSGIAANIIRSSAPSDGLVMLVFAILGLAAEVLPFFMVPRLVKSSSGMLGNIARAVNKPDSGIFGSAKRFSSGFAERKHTERKINALGTTKNRFSPFKMYAKMDAKSKSKRRHTERQLSPGDQISGLTAMDRFTNESKDYIAHQATKGIATEDRDKREQQVKDNILSRIIQLDITDVNAEVARITALDLEREEVYKIATAPPEAGISNAQRAAAFKMIASGGNVEEIDTLIDTLSEMEGDTTKIRRALADGIDESGVGEKAAHLNSTATARLRTEEEVGGGSAKMYENATLAGRYSAEQLSRESTSSLKGLEKNSHNFSPEAKRVISAGAQKATQGNLALNTSGSSRKVLGRLSHL